MFSALFGSERPMLATLAVACLLTACQEPDRATGPSLSQAALPNSITLTYICGNSFRVRNTNPAAITVTWDVYKTSESGSLLLPPKPASSPYSETYFTTVNKGTVRLFLDGALIQTKANGNKPVCQLPADTTRPAIPSPRKLSLVADTTLVASPPGDTVTIAYRNVFRVRFDDSTSGSTIRAFLVAMQGEIIGGNPNAGEYIIRFPDPGAGYAALDSLQRAILSRVGVDYAVPSKRRSGAALYSRYPSDGAHARRTDWLGALTDYTRPRIQIRAPLAWGCEAGAYGGPRVAVGVVDFYFNRALPDFAGLLTPPSEPDPSGRDMRPSTVSRDHGTEVASILAGTGDDGSGVAGMMWNADLTLFSLTSNGAEPVDLAEYLAEVVIPQAISRGVRVLVLSLTVGTSDSSDVRSIEGALAKFTAAGGLVVKAAGNFGEFRSVDQLLQTTNHPNLGAEMAVARLLRDNPQVASGLIVVSGTDDQGRFWDGGSFYGGISEILAPATSVATLGADGLLRTVPQGNSLAAPFVGGVAGLLLAMDPTLTNAQLKDYLVRGSRMEREDPETGAWLPAPSPGAPDPQVRQLDAYGSLRLLSYERPGTPLCGLAITNDGSPWYQSQSHIHRRSPEAVIVEGTPVAFTSIAPGGRLAAAGTETYRLVGGQWQRQGGDGENAVVYLERDTAYLRPVTTDGSNAYRTDLWLRLGSPEASRRIAGRILTAEFPVGRTGGVLYSSGASYVPERISIAPSGEWAYVEFSWWFNDDCLSGPPEGGEYRRLIPLQGGTSTEFSARTWAVQSCADSIRSLAVTSTAAAGGRVAWRSDGLEFYYGREYYDADTRLERWSVAGAPGRMDDGAAVGLTGFDALTWTEEGGRLLSRERSLMPGEPSYCFARVRASGSPGTIATESQQGDYYTGCVDIPLAAPRASPNALAHWAPRPVARPLEHPRYPLGIPVALRAN